MLISAPGHAVACVQLGRDLESLESGGDRRLTESKNTGGLRRKMIIERLVD